MSTTTQLCNKFDTKLCNRVGPIKVHVDCGAALARATIEANIVACDYFPGCAFVPPEWRELELEDIISQAVIQPLKQAILAKQLEFHVQDLTTQVAALRTDLKKVEEQKTTTISG